MEKSGKKYKALPWLILLFSFLTLTRLPDTFCWAGIILGIVILIEQKWPEKWGKEENS